MDGVVDEVVNEVVYDLRGCDLRGYDLRGCLVDCVFVVDSFSYSVVDYFV